MYSFFSSAAAFSALLLSNSSAARSSSTSATSSGGEISPLAGSLRRVSNGDSRPSIRLGDVPEPYREHFAVLRTAGPIHSAHPLDRVLRREWKRFVSLLKGSRNIQTLLRREALCESALGKDYPAYSECRLNLFKPAKDVFSIKTEAPTWPRTYLESKSCVCSLESPKGRIRAEFMAQATQIRLTYWGREKVIQFGSNCRLARCSIGIPYKWVYRHSGENAPKTNPVYMSTRFQPVALSPDEMTVFCIVDKENGYPRILKIQKNYREKIRMPPELQSGIRHICSMACNAANTLFIHCRQDGAQQLHIFENGQWSRLDLYRADRGGKSILDNGLFFISNVSSRGHMVFTPHDVKATPRLLIWARDACNREGGCNVDSESIQWWKLRRLGEHPHGRAPCIFAFSADGKYLAYSSRTFLPEILRIGAFIIHLDSLSLERLAVGKHVPLPDPVGEFGYQVTLDRPEWGSARHSGGQNDFLLSFSNDNLSLTRALYDPDTKRVASYTAMVPPDMALKPLFEKMIDAEIAKLESETASERKSETAQ